MRLAVNCSATPFPILDMHELISGNTRISMLVRLVVAECGAMAPQFNPIEFQSSL